MKKKTLSRSIKFVLDEKEYKAKVMITLIMDSTMEKKKTLCIDKVKIREVWDIEQDDAVPEITQEMITAVTQKLGDVDLG